MKKILFSLCVMSIIFGSSLAVSAEESVDVYINNEKLITDQPAIIYQDRTMVPVRAISEALECDVEWEESTSMVTISNQLTIIAMQINSYYLSIKDRRYDQSQQYTIPIDVAPIIYNGRTMLPARALAEALKASVEWNASQNRVDISTEFDYIADFSYDLSVVQKDGKCGYVNKNGDIVIPLIYDFACSSFVDGLALVELNGKRGFIDKSGIVRIPIIFDSAFEFQGNGLAAVELDGNWGYVDTDGNEALPFIYEKANSFYKDYASVTMNGKTGVIDLKGNIVIPYEYDYAGRIADDQIRVKLGDDYSTYVLENGKWVFYD